MENKEMPRKILFVVVLACLLLTTAALMSSVWAQTTPTARFLAPPDGHQILEGNPLGAIRVQVRERRDDPISCQEWILDGRTLVSTDWLLGSNPDESIGPCGD